MQMKKFEFHLENKQWLQNRIMGIKCRPTLKKVLLEIQNLPLEAIFLRVYSIRPILRVLYTQILWHSISVETTASTKHY